MIENYLNTQGYMLFDGAFGTYYAQRYAEDQKPCEMANLNHPKRVAAIHQEYIEAGADAIKTNTFSANEQLRRSSGRQPFVLQLCTHGTIQKLDFIFNFHRISLSFDRHTASPVGSARTRAIQRAVSDPQCR